jgi:hypothetical protein
MCRSRAYLRRASPGKSGGQTSPAIATCRTAQDQFASPPRYTNFVNTEQVGGYTLFDGCIEVSVPIRCARAPGQHGRGLHPPVPAGAGPGRVAVTVSHTD